MLQYNRILGTEDSFHPDVTKMVQYAGWYDLAHPEEIPLVAAQQAPYTADRIAAMPPGKRVVFLRGVLRYESYPAYSTFMDMFERGGFPTARAIALLRPFGEELRRRGLSLDAVWTDNEGGWCFWNLTPEQISQVYASSRARSKMPPDIRALRPEWFQWTHPNCRKAIVAFNRWSLQLMYKALRQVMVTSGIFLMPQNPGGPNVQPPTMNFNVWAPTFPVYDFNGWPVSGYSLDGRSSCPGCYLSTGGRYGYPHNHDPRWNALIDSINYIRSCMRRPNAAVFPTITWPSYSNAWIFEQMIAHWVRTGVNTPGGCGYIYWREPWTNAAVEDPLMAQIFARHDQPFPVQRNLPPISLDVDSITTAGYTTTYTDFLANVP